MSPWENYHLEWSPDPLSVTNPTWLDITTYVASIALSGGVPVTGSTAQPATLTAVLYDSDHRFLFANASSPLAPNWKPGRRIRCFEAVGSRRFDLYSGYLQAPESDNWAEQGIDQSTVVTAVDRLGWLENARKMISTLAEYIVFNGPGLGLRAYWPLLEASGSRFFPAPGNLAQTSLGIVNQPTTTSGASPLGQVTPGGGTAIPGDDLPPVRLVPPIVGSSFGAQTAVQGAFTQAVTCTNDTITACFWVWFEDPATAANPIVLQLDSTIGANPCLLEFTRQSGVWQAVYTVRSSTATLTLPGPLTPGMWHLVSLQMTLPSGAVSLWHNNDVAVTGTMASAPTWPSTEPINDIWLGQFMQGNIAHPQIYLGGAFTQAVHQAQYTAGLAGLAGQSTGQRITTLAQYAGVPATELGLIDPGVAVMQAAKIAGQTPGAAMRMAETTEQGRLRANGRGLIVFDPRTRRYNS